VPRAEVPAGQRHPMAPPVVEPWPVRDLRKVAAASTAGALTGFLVAGWGSRLAMMLLARLNPAVTGRVSDDGFVMGRFDLGDTLGLVAFGTAVGVLGGLLFLVLRELRFGPDWFQTSSMVIGPAVVVGAILVHTDGIDFRVLEPVWLAIALFVALPGLFAWMLLALSDRWLRDDSWFMTGGRWRLLALAPFAALGPMAPVAALIGATARMAYHAFAALRSATARRAMVATARLAVTAVFVIGLVDLVRDSIELL
jgi:hypothetical protein